MKTSTVHLILACVLFFWKSLSSAQAQETAGIQRSETAIAANELAVPGAGTGRAGLLATHIYTLRIPPGQCPHPNPAFPECFVTGDTLPVGPGIFYTFSVFDTGSSIVIINNEPLLFNDADLLDLCGPTGNCALPSDPTMTAPFLPLNLDLRIWGLGRVDPGTLGAPLDTPEVQVEGIQVRPSAGEVPTLIGAPVAARSVAVIDYATVISRTFNFGTIEAPDIVFFPPGSVQIPSAAFAFELMRRGSFTTSIDGASVGPRYMMKRFQFQNGGSVITEADFGMLYDTGNTTTQMTEETAIALGIDPANDTPADSFIINTANGPQEVKGFIIDEFMLTTVDGQHRRRIQNPLVYVRPPLDNPPRPPFPDGIDIVFGSNYLEAAKIVFDGPNDRLRLFEAESVNQPPLVDAGGPYTVAEGSSVAVTATGSDPDGDPLSFAWDLDNNGSFETLGASVTFSAVGLDGPDSKTIQATVSDGVAAATDTAAVSVLNVAPSVGAISVGTLVEVGATVNASANFTDPGVSDTHTGEWDWGDGASNDPGTLSGGTVTGSHAYTLPGVYTVKVNVTDDDGASNESVFQFVVVFDPSAGFVTGAGWVDSPAGAFAADPSLTGRANFGFVSKYKKGATTPTGQTNFQFRVADVHFHSSAYEWMVIAGPQAKYKGTGTINSSGNYGFLLSATDADINGGGNADKFRMRIWDRDNMDAVVYDNEVGGGEDAGPTTEIGGGSIVIHNK